MVSSRRCFCCCHVQVLQLWEVLWAHSWKQRHCVGPGAPAVSAAVPAAAAAAGSLDNTPSVAASVDKPPDKDGSKDGTAVAAAAPMQLSADARAGSPADGKGDSKAQGGSGSSGSLLESQPHLELFTCFVAAVITAQRRMLLDHCYNADDVLRLFHGSRHIDFWQCLDKAQQLLDQTLQHHSNNSAPAPAGSC